MKRNGCVGSGVESAGGRGGVQGLGCDYSVQSLGGGECNAPPSLKLSHQQNPAGTNQAIDTTIVFPQQVAPGAGLAPPTARAIERSDLTNERLKAIRLCYLWN